MVLTTSFSGKFATSVVKLFEEYSVIPLTSITALTRQSLSSCEKKSSLSSASLPLRLHKHVAQLLCSSGEWQRALAIVHALSKKEQKELIEQATREGWPLPSSLCWEISSPSIVINVISEDNEGVKNAISANNKEEKLMPNEEIVEYEYKEELTNATENDQENQNKAFNRIEKQTSAKQSTNTFTTNSINVIVENNSRSEIDNNNAIKTQLTSQIISMPLEEIVDHAFELDWPLADDLAQWNTLKKEQLVIFNELIKRHAWRELVQCAIHWERKRSRAEHALQSFKKRQKHFTEWEHCNQEGETQKSEIDVFRPVDAIQQMMFALHTSPFNTRTLSPLFSSNDANASKWKESRVTEEIESISSTHLMEWVPEFTLTLDEQTALQNTVLEFYKSFFVECVTVNWMRSEYYFTTPQSKSFAKKAVITLLKYISSECTLSSNNNSRYASTLSLNVLHIVPFISSFTSVMEEHSKMSNRRGQEKKYSASLESAWSVLAFLMRQVHRELQMENFAFKRELLELILHTLQVSTQTNKNTINSKSLSSPQNLHDTDAALELSRKTCDDMCSVMETICSVLIRNEKEVQSLSLSVFAQLVEVLSVIQCNPPNALVQCLFLTIRDEPITALHGPNTKEEEEGFDSNKSTKRSNEEDIELISCDRRSSNYSNDDVSHSSTSLMADKKISVIEPNLQTTNADIRGKEKTNDVLDAAIQFVTCAPLSRWRVALHLLTCAKQQNVFAVTSAHLHALLSGLNGLSIALTWSQALSCAKYCNTHFKLIPDELTCRRMVSNLEHASWERAFEVLKWYDTKQEKYSYSILRDLHRIAMKHANWQVTLEIMEKLIRDCGTLFSFVHYLYTIHALAAAGEVQECWKYFIMMKQNTLHAEIKSPFNIITTSIPFVALIENEHYTRALEFARLIANEVCITKTSSSFDSCDNNNKTKGEWCYHYGTKPNSVFAPYELTRSGLVLTLAVQLLCWLHLHDDKHILELISKLNYINSKVEKLESEQEYVQSESRTEIEAKSLGNVQTHSKSNCEPSEMKNAEVESNMYALTFAEVLEDTILVQSMCGLAYLRAPVRLAYSILEDRELTHCTDKHVQEQDIELAPSSSSEWTSASEESRGKRKKMFISLEHRRRRSAILAELLGQFVRRHEKDIPEELVHTIASTMANHNVGVQYLQACVL